MSSRTLKSPPSTRRTRSEWDELIRRHQQLDAERKAHSREADRLKGLVDELEAELVEFVEHERPEEKQKRVALKSFILSIVWQKPAAISLAFKAYGRLSPDEKSALADEVGPKKKLEIDWRDERPPSPVAAIVETQPSKAA